MNVVKLACILFAFLAIMVGVYPFSYFLFDMSKGFLSSKPLELVQSMVWKASFYLHITFGGLALLAGWSQFSSRIRNKNISFHRILGKIYITSVLMSGFPALYIAIYSDGGMITHFGFGILADLWLFTTIRAFSSIKKGDIINHRKWMIRSYSLCFAAVTLRILLPMFTKLFHFDFLLAYRIISWLCWMPNLLVAEIFIIRNSERIKTENGLTETEKVLSQFIPHKAETENS
jgi:uncharacterized membrane protein